MLDDLSKLRRQQILRLSLLVVANSLLAGFFIWLWGRVLSGYDPILIIAVDSASIALIGFLGVLLTVDMMYTPSRILTEAILHVSSETSTIEAPDLKKVHLGQKALTELVAKVYDLASSTGKASPNSPNSAALQDLNDKIPLPIVSISSDNKIVFVNQAAEDYVGLHASQMVGQAFYDVFKLAFSSGNTFERWLEESRSTKAVDHAVWERVKLLNEARPDLVKQLDMAAYFNKSNPYSNEVIVSFFDRTNTYEQDDRGLSFVALAVHELRTPITIMRGYIEVFEDEIADKLDGDHKRFMNNLKVSAESLGSFINNILNVARVENNQLELHLIETVWPDVLKQAVDTMSLRAAATNIKIVSSVAPDLPHVGVDHVGIYEVLTNLLDNAIKYSSPGGSVTVESHLKDGFVETTVSDTGVGIPTALLPHLFDKFYRSHRSRSQVGGTGLGLYLCKKIIEAHDGEIWVKTKENAGSTFGFKVQPWEALAQERKSSDNAGITRSAHGWIKNHSLYRG